MRRLPTGAMAALVTLFFAQGQRAYFGSLFGLAYDALFPALRPGATALATLPLLVVLVPLVPLARWMDRHTAVAICATGVALARLPMVGPTHVPRLVGGAAVVGFTAAFLTWAVGRLDRRAFAAGMAFGLVLDQLLRFAGASYDISFQPGWLPIQAALSLGLVAAAWSWHRSIGTDRRERGLERRAGGLRLRGGLALGALLFIDLHILAPAVVARWTGVEYGTAGIWLAAAGAAAVWLALVRPRPTGGRGVALVLVGLIAAGTLSGYHLNGPIVLATLAASHCAALLLATRAVEPASGCRGGRAAAAALGVLILAVALYGLTFYAAFTVPALAGGAPWIIGAAALLLAGCTVLMPRPADPDPGIAPLPAAGAAALLVMAAVLLVRMPSTPTRARTAGDGPLRVATWNVHFGFDEAWTFSPERFEGVLARAGADVIALQEAIVGGPTAYGIDFPLWLGRRLGLEDRFSSTVNGLMGEAFLVPAGMGPVRATPLPQGRGAPKQLLQLELSGARSVTINALHLSVHADARIDQIRAALDRIHGPAVILGDLNAEPGSPVIEALRTAGFSDAFGGSGPPTFPAARPTSRIDWVWTRGAMAGKAAVLAATPSDHRAVVATLHIQRGEVRSSGTHDLQAPQGPVFAGSGS